MSLDYQTIYEAYQGYMNQSIFPFVMGVKGIGLIMVLFSWYQKYLESMKPTIGEEKLNGGISAYDILSGVGIILAIGMYDQMLEVMDSFLTFIESQYRDFQVKVQPPPDPEAAEEYDIAEMGWSGALKLMAISVTDALLSPLNLILAIIGGLAWILDILIYAIFLGERFFVLGCLRILGGIALACYPIKGLRSWFWNWIKMYTAYFLMMIPFFLIVGFTDFLTNSIEGKILTGGYGGNPITGFQALNAVKYTILILGVWLKYRLFRGVREAVLRMFS